MKLVTSVMGLFPETIILLKSRRCPSTHIHYKRCANGTLWSPIFPRCFHMPSSLIRHAVLLHFIDYSGIGGSTAWHNSRWNYRPSVKCDLTAATSVCSSTHRPSFLFVSLSSQKTPSHIADID